MKNESFEINLIDTYSRKEAIEDGSLIDVTSIAKELKFKYPVALTQKAQGVAYTLKKSLGISKDQAIRTLLTVMRDEIVAKKPSSDTFYFTVKTSRDEHALYSVIGPGDTAEPVITVMVPGED
jgi:hypothetical protein